MKYVAFDCRPYFPDDRFGKDGKGKGCKNAGHRDLRGTHEEVQSQLLDHAEAIVVCSVTLAWVGLGMLALGICKYCRASKKRCYTHVALNFKSLIDPR